MRQDYLYYNGIGISMDLALWKIPPLTLQSNYEMGLSSIVEESVIIVGNSLV